MDQAKLNSEEEVDMTPNTPVVKEDSKRSKDDPNEILLGETEILDDESDDTEDYHDE